LKEVMTSMGIRLKNARERIGLTQDQVARLIDVNRVEISYYETGSREISLGKLAQLANLYGCSVDYFLSVDDSDASGVAVAFAPKTCPTRTWRLLRGQEDWFPTWRYSTMCSRSVATDGCSRCGAVGCAGEA